MKTFPLGDTPTANETGGMPLNERIRHQTLGISPKKVVAIATGEKRKPKKGEWYLSGAEVLAYKAPNDLDTVYQIAKLVKATQKTITTIEHF